VDPFLGTGTTTAAAMATGRNSIGFEIESGFRDEILSLEKTIVERSNDRIHRRIENHLEFVKKRSEDKGNLKYINKYYRFPVVTQQEIELFFNPLESVEQVGRNILAVEYTDKPPSDVADNWKAMAPPPPKKTKAGQMQLF
jgi:DNA modification methylase